MNISLLCVAGRRNISGCYAILINRPGEIRTKERKSCHNKSKHRFIVLIIASKNCILFQRKLAMLPENPLVRLERHAKSEDYVLRQVGYCAKWCLDNYCKSFPKFWTYLGAYRFVLSNDCSCD